MFSLYKIRKNWREWFSLARNLICISWNKVLLLTAFFYKTQKRLPRIIKEISIRRKIYSPSSKIFFIKISFPLEGIIGSTFRKKWKIKTMVLSKSIIRSPYKVFGFTWLFHFHFAEKCVTWIRFLFEILLFPCVREKPAFPFIYTDSMYG